MMNYVGSISILDRGDAPAQAIIDRNARSLAQRVADETKQELEKVMTRVENIYESYESSTQALFETQANLEYVEDIAELEELIKDQLKKKKYQQQVTIFIVGYENVCGQKLKLLQQVNEFFMDNSKSYEEEDWYPKTPDIDLDDCGNKIEETISTAKELTERLGDLNSEMVEWLTSYAVNKASSKGKKKLEAALSKAKDDIKTITEQLKGAQAANVEKEDLLNTYLKQLEGKTIEVQKFKAAAEVAKKNIQDMENKEAIYRDEMERRDSTIKEMMKKLQQAEMDLNQTNFMENLNSNRLKDKTNEYQIRLDELQAQVDKGKFVVEEAKRELQALHEKRVWEIQESHGKEIEELKAAHQEELKKIQEEVLERQQELLAAELEAQQAAEQADKIRQELFDLQLRGTPDVRAAADSLDGAEGDDGTPRDDSRLESRPSTKDTKSSRSTAGKGPSRVTTQVKVTAKPTKEAKSKPHKETADTAVQDEGGDPNAAHVETRQSKRTRSTLETVKESELTGDYENTFDLTDEDSWSAVPSEHIPGRFIQYRKLTQKKLLDLEDQLNLTVAKTQRKVHTLKSQFQEHKGKWEAERKVLIEQVEQAQKLQTEAEKEADVAMTQLEEFINEQERLEEEEEVKRQEVVRSVDGVNEKLPNATNVHDIATQVDSQRGSSPQTVTPVEGLIEGQREPLTTREPTTEQVDTVPEAAPQHVQTEDSEQELSKLMQQTDDAKFERQRSDIKIVSRRSSSMGSEVAPWLLHGEGPTAKSGADSMSDQEESAKSTPAMKPSISKSSFHTRSDKIQSEMSKLEDPDEAENENEDDGEKAPVRKSSVVMTTDDTKFMESSTSFGSVALKHDRKSVASKHSRLTLTSSCSDAGEVIDTEQADDDDQDEGQGSRSSTVILEDLEERPRSLPQDDSETEKSSRSRRSSPTGTEKKTIRSSRSHKSSRVEFTQSRSNERSPLEREGSVTVPASSMSRKSSLMGSSVVAQHNKESSFRSSASIVPVESRASLQGSPAVPEETRTSIQGSSPVLPATRSPLERASSVELSESRTGSIHGISRKGTRVSRRSSPGRVTSDPTFTTEETEDEPYFSVEITQHSRSHPKLTQQKQRSSDVMSERSSSSGQGQTDQRSSGQAQEINSRITSGAMSAPPAVEETSRSGSGMKDKYGNRVRSPRLRSISRSSAVSQHIARMSNAAPIEEISEVGSRSGRLSRSQSHSGGSYHKEAWLTPRLTARADDKGKGENELALDLADGLPISQASAVHNVKEMMEEVNLSSMQQRTLETVRSAIKCVNNNKDLSDIQLERTITLISLASQLTEESLHLGILPDSIFDAFADINSRDMSTMSHGDDDYDIEETHYLPADFLRPFTRGSLLTHEELSTAGARFLPEFSQASLKSLPPLDSLVWSPRSQRLIGRRKSQDPSAQKTCSAPLEKLAKHLDMKSHDLLPFDRIQSKKVNPFTTSHATKGSALKDTLSTSMSQESVEYLSRSRRLSKFGKRSPDFIDEGYDDAEIYIYRGNQVCDRGSSPAILVQESVDDVVSEQSSPMASLEKIPLSVPSSIDVPVNTPITPYFSLKSDPDSSPLLEQVSSVKTTSDLRSLDSHVTGSHASLVNDENLIRDDIFESEGVEGWDDAEIDDSISRGMKNSENFVQKVDISVSKKSKFDILENRDEAHKEEVVRDNQEKGHMGNSGVKLRQKTAEKSRKAWPQVFPRLNIQSQDLSAIAVTGLQVTRGSAVVDPWLYARHYRNPASAKCKTNLNSQKKSPQLVIYRKKVAQIKNSLRKNSSKLGNNKRLVHVIQTLNFGKKIPMMPQKEIVRWNSELTTTNTDESDSLGEMIGRTKINISGKTEEEIRTSSALSRASLRNQYRNKLGEVRAAVEDRRAKSPAISLPSQRSLEDDQLVDDDDDDMPFTDEVKELKVKEYSMDIGTSPPPGALKDQKQVAKGSRASSVVNSDHPVVGEYLKAYEGVIHFRNALSKLMLDREMLQPSQILADIDTVKFDQDTNVEPQLEKMTDNLYHVLEEVIGVLGAILLADREPMVSSLTGGLLMSRDGTQNYPHPDRVSADSGRGPTVTRASQHSSKTTPYSATSDKMALRELQEQYERLKIQFTEEGRKHEEQLRHNTVVMMEMQDTINELQRELTNLGRSSSRLRPNSDIASPQDSAIMFTRLDSERNAKIMKRAVNDQKMDSEKYKDAINKMDDYVSLPAQRLAHLVRKYVHHCRMKEIEENVKRSRSLNENVFEILDKMEALQNQRAKKWADRMDEMGAERLRLANLLMETLDSIEQESGIFLIKPMYSYRGRDVKDTRYGGKLTRPLRPQRHVSPNRELHSVFAPAPTPASNVRSLVKHAPLQAHYQQPVPPEQLAVKSGPVQPLEGDETGVTGASMNWVGTAAARQTWSLNSSVVRGDSEAGLANHMNTPRILELDINRMLIGQNTISSKMSQQGITEDRLVNASQNNLRSYITVNRPTASPSQPRQPSMTFFSSTTKEFVPPSSPASTANTTKRVRMSDVDIPRNIPSTPPLPPIPTGSAGSTHETLGEPPRSPPGSSLRQTPPHVQEVISPLK